MCDVMISAITILTTWHCDKQAIITLDNSNSVNCEAVIYYY